MSQDLETSQTQSLIENGEEVAEKISPTKKKGLTILGASSTMLNLCLATGPFR